MTISVRDAIPLRASAVVLVVANLVPVFGVLALGWRTFDIVLLYWVENVVVGAINVLRMLSCARGSKIFLVVFFIAHYGFFCFGHLMAIAMLFDGPDEIRAIWQQYFAMPPGEALRSPLWIGIAAIAASHLFSFLFNFLAAGEHRRTTVEQLMSRPYGRIFVLQVAIVAGAVLIEWLGTPVGLLLALVVIKIVADLKLHTAERELFAEIDQRPRRQASA